ncbi:MAG: helix-turn-helix domain-containing protein [Tepidisphaeraceae bacterium]
MNTNSNTDALLTPEQVAARLNVRVLTLSTWRATGRHSLPFVKIGHRVRYRASDVETWISSRSGTSCAAVSAGLTAALA